ncbi:MULTISPECIES: hypothetical protein [unclassified Bradyrhizobium]|uniref:hypothetical protein n=1 Tax=unclassified Bradyrhizobium TaxID=2631580 RepID=UPI002304D5E3|nr:MULTISPECIES: hypothetical protein [unclassified Bradyrhizobium]
MASQKIGKLAGSCPEQLRLGLRQPVTGKTECGNWRIVFFCSQRQSPSASRKVSGVAVLSLTEGAERGQSSASSPTALMEVQDEFVPQAAHARQ